MSIVESIGLTVLAAFAMLYLTVALKLLFDEL